MKKLALLLLLVAPLSCDRTDAANGVSGSAAHEEIADIDMLEFGNFEFVERAPLPERVRRWNGKMIRAVGYMNPSKNLEAQKEFELVMNRDSCCYGQRPRMNHFFQVKLSGPPKFYTSDPVKIVGRFVIDEQWDGDWQLGLYWLKEARVEK